MNEGHTEKPIPSVKFCSQICFHPNWVLISNVWQPWGDLRTIFSGQVREELSSIGWTKHNSPRVTTVGIKKSQRHHNIPKVIFGQQIGLSTFLRWSFRQGQHPVYSEGIVSFLYTFILDLFNIWQGVHGTSKIRLPCFWIRFIYSRLMLS